MDKLQNKKEAERSRLLSALPSAMWHQAVFAVMGYFCAEVALPFGANPLGLALLASAGKRAPGVYIGLALASLGGEKGIIELAVYSALLLLRILIGLTLDYPFVKGEKPSAKRLAASLFGEKIGYRALAAAVAAFALGASHAIIGGLLYYDIIGLMICLVAAPLATLIYSRYFGGSRLWHCVGFLALGASAVYGALDFTVYGVSLAVLLALLLTFHSARVYSMGFGALTGLAVGLVYSPILSPIFVFSAISVGLLLKLSPTLAFFTSFAAGTLWGFYVKGIYALDGLFAGILSACLLYSMWYRLFCTKRESTGSRVQKLCCVPKESELDGIRLYDMNRRMSAISECLASMSSFFEELKLRYPEQSELMKICEDALTSSCSGCPMSEGCTERTRIENEAGRLAFLLKKNKGLSPLDFDRELVSRCSRLPDILDEINYNSGLRLYEGYAQNPYREEILAPDYKALSRLLEKSMEEWDSYRVHTELSEMLCTALDKLELGITGVLVYGERQRHVYIKASDMSVLETHKGAILHALAPLLPFELDMNSLLLRRCSGEGCALSVGEKSRLSVSSVSRQRRALGEARFCGDSTSLFENRDNRFFSLISDGMGSGREAAAVAEICTRFMEGMLSVGGMSRELLSMLGGLLSGRCEGGLCECSATVDLLELDLISGKASFYKSGAAPSYIYRNGELFKLRSRTLPIGILAESETKRTDMTLSEGDTVVMISDGVCTNDEDCPWLFDLLHQNIGCESLERTAELIIKYAVGHGSEDDISVSIIKVKGNSEEVGCDFAINKKC